MSGGGSGFGPWGLVVVMHFIALHLLLVVLDVIGGGDGGVGDDIGCVVGEWGSVWGGKSGVGEHCDMILSCFLKKKKCCVSKKCLHACLEHSKLCDFKKPELTISPIPPALQICISYLL